MAYFAHSTGFDGEFERADDHLREVAEMAAGFAGVFDSAEEARFAGLLHDLGKYGDLFQRRLRGQAGGVDHWSAGAWACLEGGVHAAASALAVQGHHIGLQVGTQAGLRTLDPSRLSQRHPLNLKLSDSDAGRLRARMESDGLRWDVPSRSILDWGAIAADPVGQMLGVRFLFSALVDADYLCTERHFEGAEAATQRDRAPLLDALGCDAALDAYLRGVRARSRANEGLDRLRARLQATCDAASTGPTGVYTLTAPTGSGKTLAMLRFALRHAAQHRLRRVVTVLPYLSILEQTAKVYREALSGAFEGHEMDLCVLEHHSLAGERRDPLSSEDAESQGEKVRRRMAENWNSPLVVTTSVQFLESLFASRPGACRKLHRLAQSVILMDEVQTIPAKLAVPTIAALGALAARFGSTVVMATATQPAFEHLEEAARKYSVAGWRPEEIVKEKALLFDQARRTRIVWPAKGEARSWAELAREMESNGQALCVVNLKKHAQSLMQEIERRTTIGVFHLSTAMCPAHREAALAEVRERLDDPAKPVCLLVATQCIEAGVDIDFPVVFRAMGPLDSIAQAAGRCNRNGSRERADVFVFRPEVDGERAFPNSTYRNAATMTETMLLDAGSHGLDLNDPEVFVEYFRLLYGLIDPEGPAKELAGAIERVDFVATAKEYRLIDQDAVSVLVPYDVEVFESLADEVRQGRLTRSWVKRARPFSVSVFRNKVLGEMASWLEPVPVGRGEFAQDWFLLRGAELYQQGIGLCPPEGQRNVSRTLRQSARKFTEYC